jgi:hypothetical protein
MQRPKIQNVYLLGVRPWNAFNGPARYVGLGVYVCIMCDFFGAGGGERAQSVLRQQCALHQVHYTLHT